jgi:hypothetical protein
MKTLFYLILWAFILVYISKPVLSFKPFSLKFEEPFFGLGMLFFGLMIFSMAFHYKTTEYKKGYSDAYQKKLEEVEKSYINTAYEEGFKDGFNSKEIDL